MSEPFERTRALRTVIIPMARLLSRYFRARFHGLDEVPHTPAIFVAKHPRAYLYLETMVLGLHLFWDAHRPPFRVLEKQNTSLHKAPVIGWLRRNAAAIPATEEAALETLARNESVLIFPGGVRELHGPPDQLLGWGRGGFARIAARARVPVVPFAIVGADQQHPLKWSLGKTRTLWLPPFPLPVPLDYWFGAPIAPEGDDDAAIAALARRVREAASTMLARGLAERRPVWSLA